MRSSRKTNIKYGNSLRDLWNRIKYYNIDIIGDPNKEKEKATENVFSKTAENFSNLKKKIDIQVQNPQKVSNKMMMMMMMMMIMMMMVYVCLMIWMFPIRLKKTAIPLLGIHTEETRSERDTCTPMLIAALFIIARTGKQPRCPSTDEWIRKLWYIYTTEYYSAVKKNSFESVLMRWMNLEPIIQSEVSQKDKDHYSILTHIYGI